MFADYSSWRSLLRDDHPIFGLTAAPPRDGRLRGEVAVQTATIKNPAAALR